MLATILLVEDTLSDAELIKEALKEAVPHHHLDTVTDGEAALKFLQATSNRPHLILLDLNLPKKGGLEVLREIRYDTDPSLSTTPVIILTNSKSKKDVFNAYNSGCNAYLRKPISFEGLTDLLQTLGRFWFDCAILPEPTKEMDTPAPISSNIPPPKKKRRKEKKGSS
jgi:CheY-like chemotaxis protein